MSAQYLHCSSGGSYLIDCEIIDRRDFDNSMMTSIERTFGFSNNKPKYQYLIRYVDLVTEGVFERWVNDEYVEIPKFVGSYGPY